jgi:hypothetical protein
MISLLFVLYAVKVLVCTVPLLSTDSAQGGKQSLTLASPRCFLDNSNESSPRLQSVIMTGRSKGRGNSPDFKSEHVVPSRPEHQEVYLFVTSF